MYLMRTMILLIVIAISFMPILMSRTVMSVISNSTIVRLTIELFIYLTLTDKHND